MRRKCDMRQETTTHQDCTEQIRGGACTLLKAWPQVTSGKAQGGSIGLWRPS